jgi:hypothetical protein
MVRFSVWEVIYLVWSVPSCCGVHRSSCRMSTARSFPRKKIGRTVNLMAHPHLLPKLRMVGTILPPPRMLSRCAHWRMYLYYPHHEMNTGFWAGQGDKGPRNFLWDCFFIYFSCGRSLVLKTNFTDSPLFWWQLCCYFFDFRTVICIYGPCCFFRRCRTSGFINAATSASAISLHCLMTVNFHF